jgi:hypothetical protein
MNNDPKEPILDLHRSITTSWRERAFLVLEGGAAIIDGFVPVLTLGKWLTGLRVYVTFSEEIEEWVEGGEI